MTSLADELLADLEGLSDDGGDYEEQQGPKVTAVEPTNITRNGHLKRKITEDADEDEVSHGEEQDEEEEGGKAIGSLVLEGGVRPADELDAEDVQQMELGGIDDVNKIAKLESGKRMNDILKVRNNFAIECTSIRSFIPNYRKLRSTKPVRATLQQWLYLLILTRNTISSCRRTISRLTSITKFLLSIRHGSFSVVSCIGC